MKLIKEFICDGDTPSVEELEKAIEISNWEQCVVRLRWYYPGSGWYEMNVYNGMTLEDCQDALPKFYPV